MSTNGAPERAIVAGLGNEFRGDDGAGPAVVRMVMAAMAERMADDGAESVVQDGCDVVGIGPFGEPLELLGRWDGAEIAVVVDATRSGSLPGTVRVVDVSDSARESGAGRGDTGEGSAGDRSAGVGTLEHGVAVSSTHGMGLVAALRISRALGRAPRRVVLVGIEGEDFGHGTTMSPAVRSALGNACNAVREVLRRHCLSETDLHAASEADTGAARREGGVPCA